MKIFFVQFILGYYKRMLHFFFLKPGSVLCNMTPDYQLFYIVFFVNVNKLHIENYFL